MLAKDGGTGPHTMIGEHVHRYGIVGHSRGRHSRTHPLPREASSLWPSGARSRVMRS